MNEQIVEWNLNAVPDLCTWWVMFWTTQSRVQLMFNSIPISLHGIGSDWYIWRLTILASWLAYIKCHTHKMYIALWNETTTYGDYYSISMNVVCGITVHWRSPHYELNKALFAETNRDNKKTLVCAVSGWIIALLSYDW